MVRFSAGALWLLLASSVQTAHGAPTKNPSPAPSEGPSSAPSEYNFLISDLTQVFDDLTAITGPLASEDVLNTEIPFVGKSINELIGGDASKTIATLLDFSDFVQFTKDENSGQDIRIDRGAIVAELTNYLESLDPTAGLLKGEGCAENIDAVYEEGTTTMQLNFCVLFDLTRSSTLSGDGLFDNIPQIFEIDMDVSLDFDATLLFKAQLSIDFAGSGASATIIVDPIKATISANGDVDVTVGVGVLELLSTATASVDASFELTICDTACPDTIGTQLGDSDFYLQRSANYSIGGTISLGSTFPGLTLGGGASFSVVEDDIFDPAPEIDFTNFDFEDFINFSPENSVAMLRLIDSAIVRSQENEAFNTNIPLTDTSVAKVLSTGSVITSSLLRLFQKVEPYEDRPTKSLFLKQTDALDPSTTDKTVGKIYEIYVLVGDVDTELNVNPDNQAALFELVSNEGVVCRITFDADFTSSILFKDEMLRLLEEANCPGLTVCDVEDCSVDEKTGDVSGCSDDDCLLAVGTDVDDLVFIASIAKDENDVQLIGFMEPVATSQGEGSVYNFPVNTPAYPALVPRFRSWQNFTDFIADAISNSIDIVDASVTFQYTEAISPDPAQYELAIGFSKSASFSIGLNASEGIGDLIDITVSEGSSLDLTVSAAFETTFGVLMKANDDESLIVLAEACGGDGFACATDSLEIVLYYVDNEEEKWLNTTIASSGNNQATQGLEDAMVSVATITEQGESLLVIRFNPTISEVKLLLLKNCNSTDPTTTVKQTGVLVCAEDELVDPIPNDYGLEDFSLSKRKWQIAIGDSSITANITVALDVTLSTNVGGVIEVTAALDGTIAGSLVLSIGTGELLPFSDWLVGLINIFGNSSTPGFIADFFEASATFEANFDASVEPSSPFNLLATASATGSFAEPFVIDFLSKDFSYPDIDFEVNIDGIGDVRKLTFKQVVAILADVLEFLIGSNEDDAVDSCSGGLLGQDAFTYQLPVLGISVCSTAAFLQVVVSAVQELVDETSTSGDKSTTTFSSLEVKLETLLQDGVGGTPNISITTTSDSIRSELIVELTLAWTFTRTETFVLDMSEYFSEEDIADNPGLDFFANALLPGSGEGRFGIEGALLFTMGVGLEYVSATNEINPFVRGTTGFKLQLAAAGELDYDCSVGAFQGGVDAEFNFGDGSDGPMELSVGLDETLNYYLANPGNISFDRPGFKIVPGIGGLVSEVNAAFSGQVTANLTAGLSLLGLSVDIDAAISDLQAFFLGNTSVLSVDFTPSFPSFKVPTLLDILLAEPQGIIDALDDVFKTAEEASVGENGIITRFPVPFIRNGLGDALGAGTSNNILAKGRNKVIPFLQVGLNSFEGKTDTVGDVLARLMDNAMDAVQPSLRLANQSTDFFCYIYNNNTLRQESVACLDDKSDPTSVMWSLPFGQSFTIDLPLDFDLDAGNFPLEITFDGGDSSLTIGWGFDLAFGYMEGPGFFLFTFPDDGPEITIEAGLAIVGFTLDATLLFLKGSLSNGDLRVAVGLSVDMDKGNALRLKSGENATDPQYGRLTRDSFRKITKISDLFVPGATAAATVEIPDVRFEVSADLLGGNDLAREVVAYIPQLEAKIYAQSRKVVSSNKSPTRRLKFDTARRSLGVHPALAGHETAPLLRSLAFSAEFPLLADDFEFEECPIKVNATFCARVSQLTLDMTKIRDLVEPVLVEITNGEGTGFLDKMVSPLLILEERLPGISDILKKKVTVLDIAEAMIGPKSGAPTVRRIIQTYKEIKILAAGFVETGGLLLAEDCDVLDSFNCNGGVFPAKRALTARVSDNMSQVFDFKDASFLPITPAELIEQERDLKSCTGTFTLPDCTGGCSTCTGTSKVTCQKNFLACKGSSVNGLTFPFMSDLTSVVGLLSGGDIQIIDFTPEPLTFAFTFELFFILYTPPTVQLTITFEFTAVLRVGFVLDSKGIREAVEQEAPIKALNSFALKDTFDGVDEAMITLTASVTVSVDVSAVIVKVGVSGKITFVVTVDLYDPFPEKSGGLVRPFELLTSGSNPLEWFEFGIQIFITISVFIKIGLFLGFIEITLFKYEVGFKFDLIPPLKFIPAIAGMPIQAAADGSLRLSGGSYDLECTGLEGTTGNERIECIEGLGVQDFTGVKRIADSSSVASIASSRNFLIRNVATQVNTPNTNYGTVTFDYVEGTEILSNDEMFIFQGQVLIGNFQMIFGSIGMATINLPTPEQAFLKTTINDCNTVWELNGHTNIEIDATAFQSDCTIIAQGGQSTNAKLTINFGFEDDAPCEDGNIVKLSMDSNSNDLIADITRKMPVGFVTKQFRFGSPFIYVEIKMSNCEDTVKIESSTTNEQGYIRVQAGGGNDEIIIGTDFVGLADVNVRILVDGNDGNDILTINDKGEALGRTSGELSSASVLGLLFGSDGTNADVDFTTIEIVNLYLSNGSNNFLVASTPQYSETFIYFQDSNDILTVNDTQGDLLVEGAEGNDAFYVYGAGNNSTVTLFGDDDDDTLIVDGTDGNEVLAVNTLDTSTVRWSGGLNDDEITVVLTSAGSTDIELFDDIGEGINKLTIQCSNFACYLLSRRNFIANIHNGSDVNSDVERISVDIDGVSLNTVQVNLNNGENEMYFDDTMGAMNVFGGKDADSFYIGQLYNSERDEAANVNINDPVATTLTTKGYLSDGNSFSLTVNGGFGNDFFDVLRNRFLLDLNGDSDDDLFVVRSFLALDLDSAGNPDENTTLGNLTLKGAGGKDTFDLSGTSNNPTDSPGLPDYVVNSLVDIDGGTGNDKLIVVGTEADDRYVITAGSVFGGGLTISFTNIEALALTGGAGDDTLTVLSTSPNLALYLYGAEGSDTFVITPQRVDPVVSKNLRGHRGILEHKVSSADPDYDGLAVEGIAVDVLDNDGDSGAYFNVIETEAVHVMDEDDLGTFSFWLYPTVIPNPLVTVQVAAQTDVNGNPWLLLNGDVLTAIKLIFTTAEPQMITASFNPAAVRLEITDYNLLIKLDLVPLESTDKRFETTAQTIRPVSVKLLPGQNSALAKSVTVVEPNGYTYVGEGAKGWSNSYDVYLRPCTSTMIDETIVEIVPTEVGRVVVTPEFIDSTVWGTQGGGCKVTVEVTPVVDSDEEGIHFVTLVHNVFNIDQQDIRLSDNSTLYADDVLVRIYDDLVPNVIIKESMGVTSTAEVDSAVIDSLPDPSFYQDSYTIRLASQPSEDVIITIESIAKASDFDSSKNTAERVQVLVSDIGYIGGTVDGAETLQLTFSNTTWFEEQTIFVIAKDDDVEEGVDLLHFPDQPSFLAYIQGPIFIEGDDSPDVAGIREAVLFPGENDTSVFALLQTPPSELVYSELQVDTLKIFNIDVQGSSPSSGTLTSSQFVGFNMAKDLIIGGAKQNDGITYNGMEVIEFYLGKGVDSLTVEGSSVAVHYVDLGDGDDSVEMKNISGHFIIQGGDGSDTVTVASDEFTVDAIKGLLAFDGGNDDLGIDHLIVDNSGDTISDDVLIVTRNTVEIESMSNTEDEESRIPRDVFIFNLRGSTGGSFNLEVYDPVNDETVDTDIAYPTSSDIIEGILQNLIFPIADGDTCGKNETSRCAETVKVFSIGDEAFAVFFLGERLNAGVTLSLATSDLDNFTPEIFVNETNDILLRSSDVAYADVEILDITMGNPESSNSKVVVNVRGTTATTSVTTQNGNDDVFISSEANEDVATSGTVDFLHGWLDYLESDLTINAAKGRHRLMISDESSSVGKGPAIFSSSSFTAIHDDVGDIFFTANGGNWISGVNLWLSPENDEVSVVSIPSDPTSPTLQTTTSVHCGDGNDTLTVSIDEDNAVFVANGQGGDDVLDASASSIPVILFGDGGSDTLTGGTSNDIIFGDFGRVQWRSSSNNIFNAEGAIAAQAGGGGYGDFTDGILRFVTDAFSVSFDEGDSDIIILGKGDDCAIGGYLDDNITGDLGNDIIFGDSAKLSFNIDSGYPTLLSTLGCDQGGNDILSGGEGEVNYIVGGSFDDTIYGGSGMDLVFGDHATISLYGDTSHKLRIAETVDAACGGGSDEIFLGDGDDIAFGGALGDYIEGNGGQDVILGDFGVFDTETEFLAHQHYQSFIEFPDFGGNDEIYGGDGDDFILGQEGSDIVHGEAGNDDIYGGHNIDFGKDIGDELLSGGPDEDSILGDNGQIVRQLLSSTSEFPWMNGMVWLQYTEPFDTEVVRDIRRYDDVDEIGGNDNIEGGDGNDILHGQRGDDVIDGGNGQDEIYGELGSDTLSGGPGSDIVIGDVGYSVRRYEKDGSARLNTDGTWHKDIILEELGYISGVDRISQKLDVKTSPLSVESVMSASLLFVAPAYTSSGAKYSSGSDDWLTDLIQFELLDSYDDVLDGGDGDDIVIGQRGDDRISGGAGNDVLIGDAGWNIIPVHMDLPQIHQVYRALRDQSNSNYVVEGVSDKEYGILFAAEYELYPDQYGQIDYLGSIVDMVLNADHVFRGHNLLRDVLGVAGISTANGNYCVHPMFRITPGFLRSNQKMHGNDIIVSGLGDNLVIGDDIRAYSGIDISDVPEVVTIQRRIDNLVNALGIRLSTMEVDQESFSGGVIGPYDISVGDDVIETSSGGFSLVTGDTMTMIARTIGSGSFVSGERFLLDADKLKSMMQRLADVERILWDINICLYEFHTDLLIQMAAEYSNQIGQTSRHALSLANDIIESNGNGDILIGDSSLIYFHVDKSPSAYRLSYLSRSKRRFTARRLRNLPDQLRSTTISHVSRLARSAAFSGRAPFDDIPFALTLGSDTIHQNSAVNLAAGDFGFFGSVITFQNPNAGSLSTYTQSIKNVRSKLASDDPVASLQFGIKFYDERYPQLPDASKPKLHGDTFIGLGNSNAMLGEFLTGEMYNEIDSARVTRVAVNANAFSSSAAKDFAGDFFDIQVGTAANGQFGPDFSVNGIAINADVSLPIKTSMEGLFLEHRLIQDIQEILFTESGQLRADQAGSVSAGPHCFDAESSSTIAPAA